MSIIHFITIIAGTIFDAFLDHRLIKQKKNVHTAAQYIIREMFFIIFAILFSHVFAQAGNQYALYSWVLTHFIYWFLFDNAINILRNKPLIYLSDKGIDAIQRPLIAAYIVKAIFFILASLYFFNPKLYSI